jgi:hypothetical protein
MSRPAVVLAIGGGAIAVPLEALGDLLGPGLVALVRQRLALVS